MVTDLPTLRDLLISPLTTFRASLTFLTRLPVGGFPYPPAVWSWISVWFPWVGLLLGAGYALLWTGLAPLYSPWIVALLVVGFGLLVTGGFHEDGLADTADALGGGYSQDRVLTILKDSRIGVFGGLALIWSFSLRVGLYYVLQEQIVCALLLSQSLSRGVAPLHLAVLPYVTRGEAAKSRDTAQLGAQQLGWLMVSNLLLLMIGWLLGLSFEKLLSVVALLVLLNGLLSWRFRVRAGGLTGDFMGCAQQLSELTILLVLAAGL